METWSRERLEALWLTAQRWDDPDLQHVERRLPGALRDALAAFRRHWSPLPRARKARELTRMVERLRPSLADAPDLPPRALSLVATEVPREIGRRWMAQSPPPRRGFHSDRALRLWLSRLTRREPPA